MERIVITGGSGFIGKSLIRELSKFYKCIIIGRQKLNSFKIDNAVYKYIKTDYSEEHLQSVLRNIDHLIHLAAVRPQKNFNKIEYFLPNIIISSNIFNACRKCGIKNIVALSSRMVYSKFNSIPFSEDQFISPLSYYGISKAGMELIAKYTNNRYRTSIKCLRTAIVFGAEERAGSLHMDFIYKAIRKETLPVFGRGVEKKEYIYVKDVVSAIRSALEHPEIDGLFNIGPGKNISNYQMACLINSVFENEGNLTLIKNKPEDKSEFLLNIEKAKRILKWKTGWTIKQGLKDVREIIK